MREIYLDNSATTPVLSHTIDKISSVLSECHGNPSSLHKLGVKAEHELTGARKIIASKTGAEAKEIYFTSGGTESNNMAVFGAAEAKKRLGNRIVTTAIEHPSVLEPLKVLESRGYEVVYLKPDIYGNISEEAIFEAIDEKTILVSLMLLNNEIGSILPVPAAKKAIRRANAPALLHCDAAQGFGKVKITAERMGIDLMSISGHKVFAPKGVGALYVRHGVKIIPITYGGGQEKKLRPGTESTALIAGFGEAVRNLAEEQQAYEQVSALKNQLKTELLALSGIVINSSGDAFPYIFSFSVPGVKSETMIHFLADRGIYVSGGSACSKGKKSSVLTACGLDGKLIDSAIRVGLSTLNTASDIIALIDGVKDIQKSLIRS